MKLCRATISFDVLYWSDVDHQDHKLTARARQQDEAISAARWAWSTLYDDLDLNPDRITTIDATNHDTVDVGDTVYLWPYYPDKTEAPPLWEYIKALRDGGQERADALVQSYLSGGPHEQR